MEGSLKKRKITKHPCYSLSNSVFVGVQLTGKSSQEIEDVISTKFSVDVSHVLKTLDYSILPLEAMYIRTKHQFYIKKMALLPPLQKELF
ncbi:unnamed protein product [Rhizophagus irregularis]|uniref:Uncharacterized protein n=1 Tax=Rhizophagus irregularis TaxID=588596 RepID=A0A915ZLJ7_9GLOM|nr:unnamed protein product [Rhizophagus irregularis]CAB5369165.1 unnamed protein product [Rhizophagus irregularis]CAB5379170.1 unnamed protein product [Rhizophagus irregularis]